MLITIKARSHFTSDVRVLAKSGDQMWETMCDNIHPEKAFRAKEVGKILAREFHLTENTGNKYARALLANVCKQPNSALVRTGNSYKFA